MHLKNKVVVITGGSEGLGKEMAKSLVNERAKVIIVARTKEKLDRTAKEIGASSYVCDVTNEKQITIMTKKIINDFGKIDIWVNNAGIWLPHTSIEEMDLKRVHKIMEVNLFGTIHGSKAALLNNAKVIINILSVSALSGRPYSSGYCASKYAALGFTNSLREEAKDRKVKVLSVFPGGMKTHLFDEEKHSDYANFMDPSFIAEKIVNNLKQDTPKEELIIRRKSFPS